MKHTPGPWRIEKPTEFGQLNNQMIAFSGDNWEQFGAIFNGDFGSTESARQKYKEEAEANAELIARAPELLEENESLKAINKQLLEALGESAEIIKHDLNDWIMPTGRKERCLNYLSLLINNTKL